ncbi:uracil-DNA glycosylase [Methylopila jiangsuensis]|uniref:Type-4 uracil-DNA glycosylase n=1 Tax=Methylopila jiangsuensis TaxID=586230 RepID=A0A9W6JGX0_9HYPH|nr:UdgX family uracil-DNA binding protein [Methylopila jiangsuensis]MDR6284277.1 DNA polymerase [Methylopila jiangsuensis]GLK76206.1 uracil-DNA glycosylase [Methylopila jiangsuensis]
MTPRRVTLAHDADVAGWRAAARSLLAREVEPADVIWRVGREAGDLFADAGEDVESCEDPAPTRAIPRAFVELAERALLHSDATRFDLCYRLLRRVAAERSALDDAADPDVARATALAKAVRRDAHKMTAFVRFRAAGDGSFASWFEPEHHILEATAPFFVRRFAAMRWAILTPERSAFWDGRELTFGAGARRAAAQADDAMEDVWRAYYASIFNPARLKVAAMRSEMPRKYWRNLPEAALIPSLIAKAGQATEAMTQAAPTPAKRNPTRLRTPEGAPAPVGQPDSLAVLHEEIDGCRACPLWAPATQAVPGEGPKDASIMVVGEQPGDREDIAGRPFVGPAGALFDRAAAEAGLTRDRLYLTNAVKHFKFEPRGKFRLHRSPKVDEVRACAPWLARERALVRPKLVVAMGATAARAVLGAPVTVGERRGRVETLPDGSVALVTVHPAYLLRLPDREAQAREYGRFVDDLRLAAAYLDAA